MLIIIYHQTWTLLNSVSIPKKVINLSISYKLGSLLRTVNTDFTLNNCLFISVELTKTADPYKYKYSGYNIGFDSSSELWITDGSMGKNIILFGVDVSSSMYIDNKGKQILILRYLNSKDFTINKNKNIGLKGVAKFLSVDFNPIDSNNILNIHRYLMKST